MAQINPQDLDEQSFGQILMPQQAQQPAPMPEQGGGMAEVLQGEAADPGAPSMFEKGQNFAKQNPMAAQMLLHTFMRMAQGGGRSFGDTLGKGVAAGAAGGLMHLAQGKQDEEKKAAQQRQQEKEKKDWELRERGVAVNEGQLGIQEQEAAVRAGDAPSNRRLKNAQANKYEIEAGQDAQAGPLKLQQIQAQIAAVQQGLVTSRDALKTAQLGRQLTALQLQEKGIKISLDKQYGASERGAAITGAQLQNQGRSLDNMGKEQELADEGTLTPEQRLARTAKGNTAAKPAVSEEDKFLAFTQRNADMFVDDKGNFVPAKAREAWTKLRTTPEQATAQKTNLQEQYNAAFAAAKSGATFSFNGKLYKKP